MKNSEIRKLAIMALKGNWWLSTAILVCFTLIANISDLILRMMGLSINILLFEPMLPYYVTMIMTVMGVYYIFITLPLSTGLTWFYLDVLDGKEVKITNLFSAFKNYGKVIGATITMMVLVFLWSLLFIIPGVIKSISYSQTLFIIKDNPEIKIRDAINESKVLMKGFEWKYFLIDLFFIGIGILMFIGIIMVTVFLFMFSGMNVLVGGLLSMILILLSLILFSLYIYPYYFTTHAGFYRQLKKSEEQN